MTEIPEDILEAVEDFRVNYTIPDPEEVREAVAQLILAERERCAKIARDYPKQDHPAVSVYWVSSEIAADIMGGMADDQT